MIPNSSLDRITYILPELGGRCVGVWVREYGVGRLSVSGVCAQAVSVWSEEALLAPQEGAAVDGPVSGSGIPPPTGCGSRILVYN